ncbi:MAG: hypothetical protein MI750_06495 [Xanthomonadales bacterium]|jgi:hypothetical protein|nr:hypothetical protein [Xanthomonadales bacterium]
MKRRDWILGLLALGLVGCGSSSNIVLDPVARGERFSSVLYVEAATSAAMETELKDYFEDELNDYLGERFALGGRDSLTLRYRFVNFNEGNRFKRYLSVGVTNWGEGGLVVETEFLDAEGNLLGKIVTDANVEGTDLGGIQKVFRRAAKKISQFTIEHFSG